MTGGDIPIGDFSYPVTTDLSAAQFQAVYLNGTAGLALCPTGNYGMLGILQDNPNASSTGVNKTTIGAVREIGHSKAWVDTSNIVAGSGLKIVSTGVLGLGTVGSDVIVAIACETNNSTASIIEVALTARTAQGTSSRAGQLTFSIPLGALTGGTTNVVAAIPLGFTGSIVGMYGIVTAASSVATGVGAIQLVLTTGGVTRTVGAGSPFIVTHTHATLTPAGTVMSSTGTVTTGGNNTFIPTDTLTITNLGTGTYATDTGFLELHIETN